MRHGSLFSGIGGFDLAAQWMGWENVFQVEIEGYCQKVLEKNFPNVKRYRDIKEFDGTQYRGAIDILSGGFPCQPFSVAGKRKGNDDERALWFQMLRVIRQVQPSFVVAENVPGLLTIERGMVFEQVCLDLESEGYEVQPVIIPACGKNAPHKRERVWITAFANSNREMVQGRNGNSSYQKRNSAKEVQERENEFIRAGLSINKDVTNSNGIIGFKGFAQKQVFGQSDLSQLKPERDFKDFNRRWNSSAPRTCGINDGIPNRVDRLKGLGNAIVPQIAYEIFKAIEQTEQHLKQSA